MYRYFLFYKPYQVLCQFSPEAGKETLADYLGALPKDCYPVGRLDYDSEGLLLVTNDKKINHRLLNPAFAHRRTYWVQVDGAITEEALAQLEKGVSIAIDGKPYHTKPARAKALVPPPDVPERNPPVRFRKLIPTSWVALTLTEGKNRQVRKMTAAVGFPTLRLIRYSIGTITVTGITPGRYKEVESTVIEALIKQ